MTATMNTGTDSIRFYLQSIGRIPLLTQDQEVHYSRLVQHGVELQALKAHLAEQLGHEPNLEEFATAAHLTVDTLEKTLDESDAAKRVMVESNLRLVVSIAKKYVKRNLELLDLIQEGTIGLQRAVEKFDPSKGYRFSTYAYWWIRQGVTRAIAEKGRAIRLPIHVTEKLNRLKRAQRELAQQLQHTPSAKELAEALDVEPKQVREYLNYLRQPISLDMRVGENQDTQLSELLEDEEHVPEDYVIQTSLASDLKEVLETLSPQQQTVLKLRYGLENNQPMTLAKIGSTLDLSRERVRQIEREGLRQLRNRASQFQSYIAG